MGLVVAGDDEQAAGALVEPVDDPRPLRVAAAAEDLAQLVDQGRAAVRGRRVDDEAGRLVDHRQLLVEVDDPQLRLSHRSPARRLLRLGVAQVDADEQEDAGGDRDVGEVEGRPGADRR